MASPANTAPLGSPTKMTSGVSTGAGAVPVHAHEVASRSYVVTANAHACLLGIRGVGASQRRRGRGALAVGWFEPVVFALAAVGAYAERVQLRECDVGGAIGSPLPSVILVLRRSTASGTVKILLAGVRVTLLVWVPDIRPSWTSAP